MGNWTVDRTLADDLPVNTTLSGTRLDTRITGEYPEEQSLTFRHELTGSESTLTLDGAHLGGNLTLDVVGAENASNRVAFSAVNTRFDGNVHIGFMGPASGNSAIVLGTTGAVFGDNSSRLVSVAAGGGETVLFQADSNNSASQPLVSDIQLAGGSTTILTARAAGLSTAALYELISVHAQACSLGIEETLQLLPDPFARVGDSPASGDSTRQLVSVQGVGDVTLMAYDGTEGGTSLQVDHEGAYSAITDGNVEVVVAHLEGVENIPEGPLYFCTVTNTNDQGAGSLRQALECAYNASSSEVAVIGFAIPETDPGFVDVDAHWTAGDAEPDAFAVRLQSALPANYRGLVVMNGQSQASLTGDTNPWGPEIILDGSAAGAAVNGWELRSSDNRLHGLNIQQFDGHGVLVAGKSNAVTGSFLGTDATGQVARGNGQSGVWIGSSGGNLIGGLSTNARNVISGNLTGVTITGLGAEENQILGNYVGTDASGMRPLGNTEDGVLLVNGASWNRVAGNLISANRGNGITVLGGQGHVVQGNVIGTDPAETAALGNLGDGIRMEQGASELRIGADGDGIGDETEGNVIAFNRRDGVTVVGGDALRNTIRRNSIYSNTQLGIDLADDGVTLNDKGSTTSTTPLPPDTDAGPNLLQNFPEVSSSRKTASGVNAGVNVSGVLKSTPQRTFVIDLYLAEHANGSGRRWLASVQRTTNSEGSVAFSFNRPLGEAEVGQFVTTTATEVVSRSQGRIVGPTSEFSPPRQITGQGGGVGGGGGGGGSGNGVGRPLVAAALPATPVSVGLDPQQLEPLVHEALARWQAAGVIVPSAEQITVGIQDLPGHLLGSASGRTIWIDANAAGWGWFVDATPADDREFTQPGDQGEQNRMDLLSVVMHELGHLLGYDHEDEGVMEVTLVPGIRNTEQDSNGAAVADLLYGQANDHREHAWLGAWLNQATESTQAYRGRRSR